MKYDDYAGAVDFIGLERSLQRCAAIDADHPCELDRCARASVQGSVCPCIASEEAICSSMSNAISEAMHSSGYR
jgi:hypothetical protein